VRDDDVRASCFAALDVLQAQYGPELPYARLVQGFSFRGRDVPFLNRAYGIYRAAVQRGPAALSINSAFAQRRYQDEGTSDGVLYRYQDGPIDNHFNRSLRSAHALDAPLVYFIGTRPNWYRPEYPAFVEDDRPEERSVLISFGNMAGPTTSDAPCTCVTRSSAATSRGWSSNDCTRRSSGEPSCSRTGIGAPSAAFASCDCSTRLTSSRMPTRPASRS
jgi:hypothetical protein